MGITVNLVSRVVRRQATDSNSGLRVVSTLNQFLSDSEQGSNDGIFSGLGRFFGRALSFGTKSAGWILKVVSGLGAFTFSSLWGWLVNVGQRLVNFDWNSSDAELKQLATSGYLASASSWGSFVGSGLGWTAGIGLGYGVSMLCPVIGSATLARYVSGKVAVEAVEEVTQALLNALSQTLRAMANHASLSLYINSRKLLKRNKDLLPERVRGIVENWGSDNGPKVTIADSFETQIEKLPLFLQLFTEEVVDEFFDSFIEAGYIIAQELDTALAAAKAATPENPERGLILYPDRDNPNEKIVLTGTQKEIIPQVQGVLDNHRTLAQKDVGEIAAVPLHEFVTPLTSKYTLTVHFNEYDKPPFTRKGKQGRTAKLKVSDSELSISFNQLKVAFKPYSWGGTRRTTHLNNGRQLAVYGASEAECNDLTNSLLSFTSAEAVKSSYTDVNSGVPANQRKPVTRMYPYKATMSIRSRNQISGSFTVQTQTIVLWRDRVVGRDRFGASDLP